MSAHGFDRPVTGTPSGVRRQDWSTESGRGREPEQSTPPPRHDAEWSVSARRLPWPLGTPGAGAARRTGGL